MVFHHLISPVSRRASGYGIGIVREAPDGARTLCLASNGPGHGSEERLGGVVSVHPHEHGLLEDSIAPLVARFATLVFTGRTSLIEPFLQQLRWLALEHGIDHVLLPLWSESVLADDIQFTAIAMGLPDDFILTQDDDLWPKTTLVEQVGLKGAV